MNSPAGSFMRGMIVKSRVDLYKWLGVDRDADHSQIRLAYRRRSMRTHPDVPGGSPKRFAMTQTALQVLTDAKRRKHYDATGEVEETPVDNDLSRAITQIGKVITAIIEDMTKGAAIDDKDVLRMAIEKFRQAHEQAAAELVMLDVRATAKEALEKRFKRKPAWDGGEYKTPDTVKLAFRGYADGLRKEREFLIQKRDSMALAAKLLSDYTYDWIPVYRPGARYGA